MSKFRINIPRKNISEWVIIIIMKLNMIKIDIKNARNLDNFFRFLRVILEMWVQPVLPRSCPSATLYPSRTEAEEKKKPLNLI